MIGSIRVNRRRRFIPSAIKIDGQTLEIPRPNYKTNMIAYNATVCILYSYDMSFSLPSKFKTKCSPLLVWNRTALKAVQAYLVCFGSRYFCFREQNFLFMGAKIYTNHISDSFTGSRVQEGPRTCRTAKPRKSFIENECTFSLRISRIVACVNRL